MGISGGNLFSWRRRTRSKNMMATLSCRIWVCLGWTVLVAGTSKASGLFVLQTPPGTGEAFEAFEDLQQPVQPQQAVTTLAPTPQSLFAVTVSPTVAPPTAAVTTKSPVTAAPSPSPPVETSAPTTEAPTPLDSTETPIATASPTPLVSIEESTEPSADTGPETNVTAPTTTEAPAVSTRAPRSRAPVNVAPTPRTRAPSFVVPSPLVTSKAPTSAPSVFESTLSPVVVASITPTMDSVVGPSTTTAPAVPSTDTLAPTSTTVSPTVESVVNPPQTNLTNPGANATLAPVPFRTGRPLFRPTASPSEKPAAVPSVVPSALPLEAPSGVPSVMPSLTPSGMPLTKPSRLPSSPPSLVPSVVPSAAPSLGPSIAPSDVPSTVPSVEPSAVPSQLPSNLPTEPSITVRPTSVPTGTPTVAPTTVAPSALPTISSMPTPALRGPFETEGVVKLVGVSPSAVDDTARLVFEEGTKAFIENFYAVSPDVTDLVVEIEVTDLDDVTLDESETNDINIIFTQTTRFRNVTSHDLGVDDIVSKPFEEPAAFIEVLKADNRTTVYNSVSTASFFLLSPPTAAPSTAPTPAEVFPPTLSPTATATDLPTIAPTAPPTTSAVPTSAVLGPFVTEGLVMKLGGNGVSPGAVNENATLVFQDQTKIYIEKFFEDQSDVSEVTVDIAVTALDGAEVDGRRGLRFLQTDDVDIQFTQTTSYRKENSDDLAIDDIVARPWFRTTKRNEFIAALKADSRTTAYSAVTTATFIDAPRGNGGSSVINPSDDDGGGLDTPIVIIIIVVAVVGVLCFCAGLFYIVRSCNSDPSDASKSGSRGGAKAVSEVGEEGEEGKPPSHLQLSPIGGQDEVSTLAEPTPRLGVMTSNESLAGYGDQSVATVDYDYSRAYGGGGEASVSSAGGTLGSNTRGTNTVSGGDTVGTGPAGTAGTQSIFSDDASFEAHFRGGQSGQREELIDIYAPPGKLGVVIDTPDDGAPVVHAIKDSSCIADKLKVGDKLVAVDDEDVRSMTAIKVSKLISRKSANATRKLTVIRTTVAE